MDYARPDALVSTDWLAARLDAPDIRLVDGSFYLPAQKRDPRKEFEHQHIPGAVFFDIDAIADHATSLPHMLPSAEAFAAAEACRQPATRQRHAEHGPCQRRRRVAGRAVAPGPRQCRSMCATRRFGSLRWM